MNEETIIENRQANNGKIENQKKSVAWKQVTLGGVSGILMGAGLMYAGQAYADKLTNTPNSEEDATASDVQTPPVATVNEDLSFGDAFAAARAAVGPGGVFEWHGGLYNTYTANEWNAMTLEQKNDFAQQVRPVTPIEQVQVPTDAHTHVVVVHDVQPAPESPSSHDVHEVAATPDDVQISEQQIAQNFDMGEDVHIVGYANADGHLAVGYDSTGDGEVDVAIIDVDDNLCPSDADVIVDREGNMAHLGDLNDEPDPNQLASMENPDVAPDMPDYMNDANLDDMNVLA